MSTFNDIRVKFQVALNEASKLPKWQEEMQKAYNIFKPNGRWVAPGTGEIARIELNHENPEQDVEDFLAISGVKDSDYTISTGNYSGKFDSYAIKFTKPYDFFGKEIKAGETWGIVNAVEFYGGSVQVIGDKDLTPDSLGLAGDYTTKGSITNAAGSAIKSKVNNVDYQQFCIDLIEAVQNYSTMFNSVDDVEGINKAFTIKHDLSKYVSIIDAKSIKTIEKDFGEILGGIFMFNLIKDTGSGLTFPKESNLELVDFFFNGLAVSSKAGKGAKASASGYINAIERAMSKGNWTPSSEETEVVNNVLVPLSATPSEPANTTFLKKSRSSSTFSNTVNLFNINLGSGSSWDFWTKSTGINPGSVNRDALIQSFIDLKDRGNLNKTLSKFVSMTSLTATKGKSSYLLAPLVNARNEKESADALQTILDQGQYDILIGIVMYACSKELQTVINSKYSKTLTSIINKSLSVKQLYLDMKIKSDSINFHMKAMENSDFAIGTLNGIDSWGMKALTIYMVH